jgi:hypothetical protein
MNTQAASPQSSADVYLNQRSITQRELAGILHANGVPPGSAERYARMAKTMIDGGTDHGTAVYIARQVYHVNSGYHWHLKDPQLIEAAKQRAESISAASSSVHSPLEK